MNAVKSVYSELVDRRLWPLALGLVVAIIAVPVLLSKPANENGSTGASGASTTLLGGDSAKLLGETKPAVTVPSDANVRKHVDHLPRKDPFIQQAKPKVGKSSQNVTLPTTGTSTNGSGTVTVPATTTTPTTPTTPTKPKQFNYQANVKFGEIGSTKKKSVLPTDPLPSTDNPIVVFMGASTGGGKAVFVVASGVTARGDGDCKPSSSKCNFVYLSKGDVEFFEVPGEGDTVTTYELDLVSITTKTVSSTTGTSQKPNYDSQDTSSAPTRQDVDRARNALRSKRVFKALGLLGF